MYDKKLTLKVLHERLGICRLDPVRSVPDWAYTSPFFSVTRILDELFLVCVEELIPEEYSCNKGWKCLKVQGLRGFSETGIISSLTRPIAQAQISSHVLSTWSTEYLLVKESDLPKAIEALAAEGHRIFYETAGL